MHFYSKPLLRNVRLSVTLAWIDHHWWQSFLQPVFGVNNRLTADANNWIKFSIWDLNFKYFYTVTSNNVYCKKAVDWHAWMLLDRLQKLSSKDNIVHMVKWSGHYLFRLFKTQGNIKWSFISWNLSVKVSSKSAFRSSIEKTAMTTLFTAIIKI